MYLKVWNIHHWQLIYDVVLSKCVDKNENKALAPGPPVAPQNYPRIYLLIYSDSNRQDVSKNHLGFQIAIWKRVTIRVQSWQKSDIFWKNIRPGRFDPYAVNDKEGAEKKTYILFTFCG